MSHKECLGCETIVDGVICCDPCWKRIPTDLPDFPRWRTSLKFAKSASNWMRAEDIQNAVRAWLSERRRNRAAS